MLNPYPHVQIAFMSDPHLRPPVSLPHPRNCRTVAILRRAMDMRRKKLTQ